MAAAAAADAPAAVQSVRISSGDLIAAQEQVWADAGERLRGVNVSEKYLEAKERELQR